MKQIRLVVETEHLINREWLAEYRLEHFQEQMQHFIRDHDEDVFRLVTVFVDNQRALMLLLLDRGYMLEILGSNSNPDIPIPSIARQLLRHLHRERVISYSREYEEQYVEMGLPVVSVNYARPIVPGIPPEPERFTANLASLFQEKEPFREMVRETFGDDPAVESILDSNGMVSLLVLEDGTQVAAVVSRGSNRWIVSDPHALRDKGVPVGDVVFGRFLNNLMASLPKGDMLVYSSTIQAANNRVTWLIMNGFVPESYLHHRALKEH